MIPTDPTPPPADSLPITTDQIFALVAEHTHNAAIVTDSRYRILWVNPSFIRVTGYTLDEARGLNPLDFLIAPDSDPAVVAELRGAIDECRPCLTTLRNRRKDGTRFWARIQAQPIHTGDKRLAAWLTVGADVSDQVERETLLRRNEALFNEAQRIAHIGSWDNDLIGKTRWWSAETFRIFGLPVSDIPPADVAMAFFIPAHQGLLEAAFKQCCHMGVPYDIELQLRTAAGAIRWVRCIGHAYTQGGRVVRVAGTIQDIDERKRSELEVSRLAERMTLAAKFAGIGIWENNHETGELIWDDAMLALHGLRRDAFPGDSSIWELVMIPEDRDAAGRMRQAIGEGRGEFDIEYRVATPSEEIRYIRNCGRIIRDGAGRVIRSYGVNYDVTRERVNMIALLESDEHLRQANASLQATIEETRRLAREAAAASQAKSTFLATISHEIRTPLNGVIGMTNILAGTPLNDEQRDYLNSLKLSGESLLTLINDTLDYSKIEAGRVELERQPFELTACLHESLDLVEPHARQKNLALGHLFAADLPRTIEGDASRLRQILVNLLGNAVKFTDRGGASLTVWVESLIADEAVLAFSVGDTGIGIPKDKQSRLFEHFFQVNASITRTHGGTGLGLAISLRLAELMGGVIRVESEPGRGATFTLTVRAPVVIEDALLQHAACLERLRDRRVLLVADTADLQPLERHARKAGIAPSTATSAAAALAHLTAGDGFDLVVADTTLPGMNGLEFARTLQGRGLGRLPMLPVSRIGPLSGATAPRYHQLMAALLPLAPASPAPPSRADATRIGDSMPLSILMAEDNNVNQRVAQLTLRRLGYEIEVVSDGAEVLGALERRAFDVILMDVQMPRMDGLEAARRVRAQPGHDTRPWIIALTAGAFEEDRLNAFRAGMNDFLSKPLHIGQLEASLARAWHALQEPPPNTALPGFHD